MDRKRLNERGERGPIAWGLIGAVAFVWLLAASPAWALNGQGSAELKVAQHDRGRTLSGQGVTVLAASPAQKTGSVLSLPISAVELGSAPAASSDGGLQFKRGNRSLLLSGIRLDLAAGTLGGKLGGDELAVFKLGAEPRVDAAAGSLSLSEGSLRLTADAAALLKQKLGLGRALRRDGVGMVWLSAQAAAGPKPGPALVKRPVVSGAIDWGFKASWRGYVISAPPAGSQEVLDGAAATGPLTSPATTYGFPATGGLFTSGAGDGLTLTTGGAVKWAKPGHGIDEVRFADLEIEIGSTESWLIGDVRTEIGPPAETDDVRIAELETTAITPQWSSGGNTVTWSQVPATLTAEGAASFSGFYEAGAELDPVTVTAALG